MQFADTSKEGAAGVGAVGGGSVITPPFPVFCPLQSNKRGLLAKLICVCVCVCVCV